MKDTAEWESSVQRLSLGTRLSSCWESPETNCSASSCRELSVAASLGRFGAAVVRSNRSPGPAASAASGAPRPTPPAGDAEATRRWRWTRAPSLAATLALPLALSREFHGQRWAPSGEGCKAILSEPCGASCEFWQLQSDFGLLSLDNSLFQIVRESLRSPQEGVSGLSLSRLACHRSLQQLLGASGPLLPRGPRAEAVSPPLAPGSPLSVHPSLCL